MGHDRADRQGPLEDRERPDRPSNIGGPIQIASEIGRQADEGLASLALFTAIISVNLAVLNLLPVPMLDGGHLFFFVIEAVLGRPLSLRKREAAQQVGFVLLMLLMVLRALQRSRADRRVPVLQVGRGP